MPVNSFTSNRWLSPAVPTTIGLLFVAVLLMNIPADRSLAQGAATHSGHAVVQFANGDTAVRPITWTGAISRVAALETAGFN